VRTEECHGRRRQPGAHGEKVLDGVGGAVAGSVIAVGAGKVIGKAGEALGKTTNWAKPALLNITAKDYGIPLSKGQGTQNIALLRYEGILKNIPLIGEGDGGALATEQSEAIKKVAADLGIGLAATPGGVTEVPAQS
jgi:hypothetical protein